MTTIAFLGLGAMGSRMAAHLLAAGHELTVWNRSPQAAEALAGLGAKTAATPRQAVAQAEFVFSMVRDDDASRSIWLDPQHGALTAMRADAVAVECSTLTEHWSRELAAEMTRHGTDFLEAPVSGSRPQAEQGILVFLVGGEQTVYERAKPLLAAMGKTSDRVIGGHGSGALAKLCTNTLLAVETLAVAEIMAMLTRRGADTASVMNALSATPVWSASAQRAADSIAAADFAPLFPIDLMEKDLGYMLKAVADDSRAPLTAAARAALQQAKQQGLAQEQITAVYKLYR